MDSDRYLWLVTSKPDPEREEEYNKWYDQHVETVFKFPGYEDEGVENRFDWPKAAGPETRYI